MGRGPEGRHDTRIKLVNNELQTIDELIANYFFPFFLAAAFFEGTAFFCAAFAPRFPPNACSQPSEYFWFVPTRVIVTARTFTIGRDLPGSAPQRPVDRGRMDSASLGNEIVASGQAAGFRLSTISTLVPCAPVLL
jgi:hypothetical protein